jgi:hypothetical protein
MSKHNSNGCRKVVKQLGDLGVKFKYKTKGIMLLVDNPNIPNYMMHFGEKAIHPVRKWAKKHFKVDLKF